MSSECLVESHELQPHALTRRSAIRRSAVGDKSRVQLSSGDVAEARSRSRRGSVSSVASPSAVVYNMSPRRPSDICSESSEDSPVISRSSSREEESYDCGETCESMEVEDGMFLSYLLSLHADGLDGCGAVSDFDTLFSSSECASSSSHCDYLLSEEDLLSLLA